MPKTKRKSDRQRREERRVYQTRYRSQQEERDQERDRDAQRRRQRREDDEVRSQERQHDAQRRRQRRDSEDVRSQEQEQDTERRRQRRESDDVRSQEQQQNTERRRQRRQSDDVRSQEQEQDTERRRQRRESDEVRSQEQSRNTEAIRRRRSSDNQTFNKLSEKYKMEVQDNPTHICSCCGGLWPKKSVTIFDDTEVLLSRWRKKHDVHGSLTGVNLGGDEMVEDMEPGESLDTEHIEDDNVDGLHQQSTNMNHQFLEDILLAPSGTPTLCATCKSSIMSNPPKIPKLCLKNGFDFHPIPQELKDLSPLEERLVALRLPFMQIRELGTERQRGLKGNVVNVPNNLDKVAAIIPRELEDTSTVQVKLKRRLRDERHYMYEVVRPRKVYDAASYLINQELYVSNNVQLSRRWQIFRQGETIRYIVEEEDRRDVEETLDEINSTSSNDSTATSNDEDVNMGVDESLIFMEYERTAEGIAIAPGEGNLPLPLYRDICAEELSFPTIYVGRRRQFMDGLKFTYTDIAKSEIRRYDRRAATATHLLYAFKVSYNEKVRQAVQVFLRKSKGSEEISASQVKDPCSIDRLISQDQGYAAFKNLRSSPPYWEAKAKVVRSMVRQVGAGGMVFITLSAAETKWGELLVALAKNVEGKDITEDEALQLPFEQKAKLIRSDPVTCMRHFDIRYRALKNRLLLPEGGVFSPSGVTDHFSRMEFQMRGSPHSHGLYWIKDAPQYIEGDADAEQSCLKFIDSVITCTKDEEGKLKELIGYQLHNHSATCKKRQVTREGLCRFGFPKPPMSTTKILTPLPRDVDPDVRSDAKALFRRIHQDLVERGRHPTRVPGFDEYLEEIEVENEEYILAIRSSIKRTTVFLKRKLNETYINPYNREILEHWGANMDIQFVLDTYACAKYCVGYILKSAGGISQLLRRATEDIRSGDLTIREKLSRFSRILINGSEISAQEAAAFVLGMDHTHCSRQATFVNTSPPEERTRILKTLEELENLEDDSTEIFAKGILEHYIQRPAEMEEICLADFATLYEFRKTKKVGPRSQTSWFKLLDGTGWMQKRTKEEKRKILRFRHYGRQEDARNYWREQLMLFVPWRDEEMELIDIDSIAKAEQNQELIITNSKYYYYDRELDETIFRELLMDAEEDFDNEDGDPDREDVVTLALMEDQEEDLDYLEETIFRAQAPANENQATAPAFENFLPPQQIDRDKYFEIMRELNEKQRRIVLNTLHVIKTNLDPSYTFLHGGAGVGKSRVITAIVQSTLKYFGNIPGRNPEELCVLVSAPTGKAAFNVFGMTLHCTFRLPPVQRGEPTTDLKAGALNTLRMKLAGVKMFIVDEISMVSNRQLYDIDRRLQQIYDSRDKPFGGKSILVVGHLRQLPPIAAPYVFLPPAHLPRGEIAGDLWDNFQFYELTQIMRQQDSAFCQALNNMSEGVMTRTDIALLKSRQITETNQPADSAIWLFQFNKQCQIHNQKVHDSLNTLGALSRALDKLQGHGTREQKDLLLANAATWDTQKSDGIPYETYLKVEGQYFISTNICVSDGLFNGATGTLVDIDFKLSRFEDEPSTSQQVQLTPSRYPYRAWMLFQENIIGHSCRTRTKNRLLNDIRRGQLTDQERMQHTDMLEKLDKGWTPIPRITRKLTKNGRQRALQLVRSQIPLVAANGMTIPKAQGSTCFGGVVVNVIRAKGLRKMSREELYVACSRSPSAELLWINGEFEAPNEPPEEDPVTKELERLKEHPLRFSIPFLQDIGAEYVKLYFHNVESLPAYLPDLTADHCPMSADVIALVEPHLMEQDQFDINGFTLIHRTDCRIPDIRRPVSNSEGAVLLRKDSSLWEVSDIEVFKDLCQNPADKVHCIFVRFRVADTIVVFSYKSPKYPVPEFRNRLREQLDAIEDQRVLFMGDININLKDSENVSVVQLFEEYGLFSQLDLNYPSSNSGNHIDVCFSNFENMRARFYESYYSVHKPLCIYWMP